MRRYRIHLSRALGDGSLRARLVLSCVIPFVPFLGGCDAPSTNVVVDNRYSPNATPSLVIYRAFWQAVAFDIPVLPGDSSEPESTAAASANTAYVLLAPGWNPHGAAPPTAFLVMQSRDGYGVHLDETLHIPVADDTFIGNCAAGSVLSQDQADFITRRVFADVFTTLAYDAASCMTTQLGDAGLSQ